MSTTYKGHWAEKSIEYALSLSIIKQKQLGSLDRSITRAEFAAMLLRAFPCETATLSKAKNWSDIEAGSALEKMLQRLSTRGWILGDSGKFRPNDTITRREALEITGRIIGITPTRATRSPFPDVSRNDPSFERFVALQKLGVLSGGNLRPNQAITLAETLNYLDTAFWKTNR
jgi:S-layer homology domain